MAIYKLIKIEKDKGEVSVELSDEELDVIYDALNEVDYDDELCELIQNKIHHVCTFDMNTVFTDSSVIMNVGNQVH